MPTVSEPDTAQLESEDKHRKREGVVVRPSVPLIHGVSWRRGASVVALWLPRVFSSAVVLSPKGLSLFEKMRRHLRSRLDERGATEAGRGNDGDEPDSPLSFSIPTSLQDYMER